MNCINELIVLAWLFEDGFHPRLGSIRCRWTTVLELHYTIVSYILDSHASAVVPIPCDGYSPEGNFPRVSFACRLPQNIPRISPSTIVSYTKFI